jgi:hypothetical protein
MAIDARGCCNDKSVRPPAPWAKSDYTINLTWHHLIPYAVMLDCWMELGADAGLYPVRYKVWARGIAGECRIAFEIPA